MLWRLFLQFHADVRVDLEVYLNVLMFSPLISYLQQFCRFDAPSKSNVSYLSPQLRSSISWSSSKTAFPSHHPFSWIAARCYDVLAGSSLENVGCPILIAGILRVNHKPMKMPIWSDIKTFHSNWTKCLIYKYISDQHYIFLPPIRSSTQSPCLPSSVIPTSLLRSPGSRFRLLRHVRPDHFFFSFLSDHSTSWKLCIIFSWPVNTALMD